MRLIFLTNCYEQTHVFQKSVKFSGNPQMVHQLIQKFQELIFLEWYSQENLMSVGLPLMKNVVTPLAKSVLLPWRLATTTSAINTAIQKKIYGSATTALVFSNEDLNDIMKIIKSLEISSFLIKGVSETVKNEAKKTKRWISWYLLGIWGASFLRNILAIKIRVVRSSKRWRWCY